MITLGIESSCDETSAAILVDGRVRSNIISSQLLHGDYGGVVPELASRAHLANILPVIDAALQEADVTLDQVELICATQGPGLIGSLLVGLTTAKAIALARAIPFLPVHHLEAHMFSCFVDATEEIRVPFLALVVSGGHTLLARVDDIEQWCVLGSTIDDAAGEAFDKVAKMLGLSYPGGVSISARAEHGNPHAHAFPRPLLHSGDLRFSFSGLKTAVLYHLRRVHATQGDDASLSRTEIDDVCASFQEAVVEVLVTKSLAALKQEQLDTLTLTGGVSANQRLRTVLSARAAEIGCSVHLPHLTLSTDNAAMIALIGEQKYRRGVRGTLSAEAFARVPLPSRRPKASAR